MLAGVVVTLGSIYSSCYGWGFRRLVVVIHSGITVIPLSLVEIVIFLGESVFDQHSLRGELEKMLGKMSCLLSVLPYSSRKDLCCLFSGTLQDTGQDKITEECMSTVLFFFNIWGSGKGGFQECLPFYECRSVSAVALELFAVRLLGLVWRYTVRFCPSPGSHPRPGSRDRGARLAWEINK